MKILLAAVLLSQTPGEAVDAQFAALQSQVDDLGSPYDIRVGEDLALAFDALQSSPEACGTPCRVVVEPGNYRVTRAIRLCNRAFDIDFGGVRVETTSTAEAFLEVHTTNLDRCARLGLPYLGDLSTTATTRIRGGHIVGAPGVRTTTTAVRIHGLAIMSGLVFVEGMRLQDLHVGIGIYGSGARLDGEPLEVVGSVANSVVIRNTVITGMGLDGVRSRGRDANAFEIDGVDAALNCRAAGLWLGEPNYAAPTAGPVCANFNTHESFIGGLLSATHSAHSIDTTTGGDTRWYQYALGSDVCISCYAEEGSGMPVDGQANNGPSWAAGRASVFGGTHNIRLLPGSTGSMMVGASITRAEFRTDGIGGVDTVTKLGGPELAGRAFAVTSTAWSGGQYALRPSGSWMHVQASTSDLDRVADIWMAPDEPGPTGIKRGTTRTRFAPTILGACAPDPHTEIVETNGLASYRVTVPNVGTGLVLCDATLPRLAP